MVSVHCRKCSAVNPDFAKYCCMCGASMLEKPDASVVTASGGSNLPNESVTSRQTIRLVDTSKHGSPLYSVDTVISANETPGEFLSLQTYLYAQPDSADATPLPLSPADMALLLGDDYKAVYEAVQRSTNEISAIVSLSPALHNGHERERDDSIVLPAFAVFETPDAEPRAEHLQPAGVRAEHLQPAGVRAEHLQPAGVRAEHLQPLVQNIEDHQTQTLWNEPELLPPTQPLYLHAGMLAQDTSKKKRNTRSSVQNILLGICAVLVITIVAFLSVPLINSGASPSPTLSATNAGNISPGGFVTVHGAYFVPGGSVIFSADGSLLAQSDTRMQAATREYVGLGVALLFNQATHDAISQSTSIRTDGTFDATLTLPQDWEPGSIHEIQATEQSSGEAATTKILLAGHLKVVATPKPEPTSTPISVPAQNVQFNPIPITNPEPVTPPKDYVSNPAPNPVVPPAPAPKPQPNPAPVPTPVPPPPPIPTPVPPPPPPIPTPVPPPPPPIPTPVPPPPPPIPTPVPPPPPPVPTPVPPPQPPTPVPPPIPTPVPHPVPTATPVPPPVPTPIPVPKPIPTTVPPPVPTPTPTLVPPPPGPPGPPVPTKPVPTLVPTAKAVPKI